MARQRRSLFRLIRRTVGLQGKALDNARRAVQDDDAARAHRNELAAQIAAIRSGDGRP